MTHRLVILLTLFTLASAARALAQALPTTPVAVTGQSAPQTGARYDRFGASSINPSGQVAFQAWLAGDGVTGSNDSAAFVSPAPGDAFRLLAREGQPAPVGGGGFSLGELLLAGGPLTPEGQSMVFAMLPTGAARPDYVFLAGTPDDLRVAYRIAPNESVSGDLVLNSGPRAVIWGLSPPHLVLWEGADAVSVDAPGDIFHPTINGPGRIALNVSNSDSGPRGLYAGRPGNFQPVAVVGAPAPGLPAGNKFEEVLSASQNNAGQLAFLAATQSDNPAPSRWGLWAGRPDDLRLLARDGDAAPGLPAGYKFDRVLFDIDSPTTPALGGAGHVPFWATYNSADGTDEGTGVWLARAGEPTRLIARTGDAVPMSFPGVPQGLSLINFLHNGQWVNGAGQVVFLAEALAAGSFNPLDTLLASGPGGGLTLIALEGAPFEVAPGDFRTVSDILVGVGQGTGGEDGRFSAFNDAGQLVYRLSFSDGTSGVFLTTVPDPSAAAPLLIAAAAVACHGRRRRSGGVARAAIPSPAASR